ncbi:MAG: LemA family protein [Lentisphaerae bacterium]|nr:LemA family protein [Lentisphaerota bacterium]
MSWGLIITIIAVVIIALWWISTMNGFRRLKVAIQEAWSGIDVQLKRKANIIPNLVDTLKMQMDFESKVLTDLTAARSGLVSGNRAEAMAASDKISAMLPSIRATAENYPSLGTNQSFLRLMEDIRDCEDKITYARNRYNMTVAKYNADIIMFPASIVSGMMHLAPESMFEISAQAREDADNMRISKL